MNRKIDDIKDPQIRALAWKYRKANKNRYFDEDTILSGFNWEETKEGWDYWIDIDDGNEYITDKMREDHHEIFKKKRSYENKNTRKRSDLRSWEKIYSKMFRQRRFF